MWKSNDQYYHDLMDAMEEVTNMDLLEAQNASLESSNILTLSSVSPDSYTQSSSASSFDDQSTKVEGLQIIEQPYQSSKLRYRTDYIRETSRLGAIGNKNKQSKLKGPAIRIPQCYLNPNDEYYICVSLVTIKHSKTNIHYIHPYELEHAKNESLNDRHYNSVWFPIKSNDSIKNFPLLRIVKKKALNVQNLDHLHVFDYPNYILQNTSLPQHSIEKEIDVIKEYNLEKSQLAFTVGKKIIINGQSLMRLYPDTTVFSDYMDENNERVSDTETDAESSNNKLTSSSSNNYIYKYAPRHGIIGNNDEMLIFLNKKLERKKYGNLKIVFKYEAFKSYWSRSIDNIDIKDRMISFKIPDFPYSITRSTTVDVTLRQDDRILGVLKYSYLPSCE